MVGLYLNVYRPAGATKAAPVLFWIFGGGFTMGGGNETRLLGGFNVELVYPAPYIIVTTNCEDCRSPHQPFLKRSHAVDALKST